MGGFFSSPPDPPLPPRDVDVETALARVIRERLTTAREQKLRGVVIDLPVRACMSEDFAYDVQGYGHVTVRPGSCVHMAVQSILPVDVVERLYFSFLSKQGTPVSTWCIQRSIKFMYISTWQPTETEIEKAVAKYRTDTGWEVLKFKDEEVSEKKYEIHNGQVRTITPMAGPGAGSDTLGTGLETATSGSSLLDDFDADDDTDSVLVNDVDLRQRKMIDVSASSDE